MLCTNCGRRPAQQYKRIVDGKEVIVELCPACYQKLYPEKESNFFLSVLSSVDGVDAACPVCGTTFGEFRRTGLLGCAGCYEAFRVPLSKTVRSVQGSTQHRGKRPTQADAEERYDRLRAYIARREALREEMERAMRRHDYERAQQLQQALKAMSLSEDDQ